MSDQTGVRRPRTAHPTKLPGIPKPPADVSPSVRQYLNSVSEALEVRLGRKGDPRDAAVTFRDLIESGIAVEVYYGGGNVNGPGLGPPGGDGPGVPGVDTPVGPTGFRGSAAMYNISLWWNSPRYEYGGHSYTEVWRAAPLRNEDGSPVLEDDGTEKLPLVEDAIMIGTSVGTTYVDPVGPLARFFYWIRHVNIEGEAGPWAAPPYPAGLELATEADVELLLELLDGLIGTDQLAQDLQDQIALISELEGFTGYYENWEVDGDLVTRINAISSSSEGNQIIIEELSQVVDGLSGQYTVKIQTNTASGGSYVAGFGLASTPVNGVPTSRFIVAADQFAVIEPATYNINDNQALDEDRLEPYTPFQILTRPTEYDGIEIPRGVYIKDAYIGQGRILKLIAGSVVADFIESTVAMEAPFIFGGSINVGEIVKPRDPVTGEELGPRYWEVTGNKRVSNFSVDSSGIMHATGASLYGITIYAQDGTILLDSGGLGIATGGNIIPNGELNHPLSIFEPPARNEDPFIDSQGVALKGWVRGNNWSDESFFAAGENQCFQLQETSEIKTGFLPVMSPIGSQVRPLYLTIDTLSNDPEDNYWYAQILYYAADKEELLGGSYRVFWNDKDRWAGTSDAPSTASARGQHSCVFVGFANARTVYVRLKIVTSLPRDKYVNFYDVYLGNTPIEVQPQYASTYIRDLSVNTLMIGNNAVTVPIGASDANVDAWVQYSGVTDGSGGVDDIGPIWLQNSIAANTGNIGGATPIPLSWTESRTQPAAVLVWGCVNVLGKSGSDYRTVRIRLIMSTRPDFSTSTTVELQRMGGSQRTDNSSTYSVNYTIDTKAFGLEPNQNYYFGIQLHANDQGGPGPTPYKIGKSGISVVGAKK